MANTKITSRVIADDAILTANIADDQITSALIADDVALGGNPTTSTQTAGNNTTRIATTAFVSTAVANIVNSAPSTLDTLGEIATALNNDAALNTTLTNSIATKLPLAGGTMTGTIAGFTSTGIDDNADATAITIDSSERVNIGKVSAVTGHPVEIQANSAGQGLGIYGRASDDFSFLGFYENGANTELASIRSASSGLTIDVAGDITLDADGGDILLKDGGTQFGQITNSSNDLRIISIAQDKDIILRGNDGGTYFNALTLDMSDAGTAYFNNKVGIGLTGTPQGHLDINTESAEATTVIINGEINQDKILKFRHHSNSEGAGDGYAGFIGSVVDNVLTLGHYNSSNTEVQALHVTEGGNVGIGTSAPKGKINSVISTADNSSSSDTTLANSFLHLGGGEYGSGRYFLTTYGYSTGKTNSGAYIGGLGTSSAGAGKYALVFGTRDATTDTAPTERMRIDTSGNVGIGTASAFNSARLSVTGGVNGAHAVFSGQASRGLKISTENTLNNDDGVAYDAQTSTGKHLFKVAGSEKMRIHSTGKLTVGGTPSASNGVIEANYTGNAFTLWLTTTAQNYLGFESTESGGQAWSFRTAGTGTYGSANGDLLFVNGTGGIFMRLDQSAATVEGDFNDTSDIGMKKNIKDTTDGLAELLKLKARKFDWKDKDKRNNVNGFIAQEVETVLPDEVIGDDYNEKKPEHGNKSINTSGLLAVAVKAIQEQQTIIEDLKARIETLEG